MVSRGETGSVAMLLLVEYCDEIFSPPRAFAQRLGVFLSWMGNGRFRPGRKFCRWDRHSMDARVACRHSRPITLGLAHSLSVPFLKPFPARPRQLEEKISAPSSPMRANHLGHSRVESSYRSGPGPAPPPPSDIGHRFGTARRAALGLTTASLGLFPLRQCRDSDLRHDRQRRTYAAFLSPS